MQDERRPAILLFFCSESSFGHLEFKREFDMLRARAGTIECQRRRPADYAEFAADLRGVGGGPSIVHISCHCDGDRLELSGGALTPEQLIRALEGTDVALLTLNCCLGQEFAAKIRATTNTPVVFWTGEPTDRYDALPFVEVFYEFALQPGETLGRAVEKARGNVPQQRSLVLHGDPDAVLVPLEYATQATTAAGPRDDRAWASEDDIAAWKKWFEYEDTELIRKFNGSDPRRNLITINNLYHGTERPLFQPWENLTELARDERVEARIEEIKGAGIRHRFFGLVNLRQNEHKAVWIVWDALTQDYAVIKEMRPLSDVSQDKATERSWTRKRDRLVAEMKLVRELAKDEQICLPQLLGAGKEWFATALSRRGSLYQDVFPSRPEASEMGPARATLEAAKALLFTNRTFLAPPTDEVSWARLRDYFVHGAMILAALHERTPPIVHRDLHPANLLLIAPSSEKGEKGEKEQGARASLIDFDRALKLDRREPPLHLTELPWELRYLPPERRRRPSDRAHMSGYHGTPEGDVFMLAAIMFDVFFPSNISQPSHQSEADEWASFDGARLSTIDASEHYSKAFKGLLRRALSDKLMERPSARALATELRQIGWEDGKTRTLTRLQWVGLGAAFSASMAVAGAAGLYFFQTHPCMVVQGEKFYSCHAGVLGADGDTIVWDDDGGHLLKETTKVPRGVTLQIEAGTHVVADTSGALIIEPGARLVVRGTAEQPVVFSGIGDGPASWGGIVMLGRAPVVKGGASGPAGKGEVAEVLCDNRAAQTCSYGGDDVEDDSGRVEYLRIEETGVYARFDVSESETEVYKGVREKKRFNGLTLAGVGSGTVLRHITVVDAADDCFEFYGGAVNAEYLLCINVGDDAFDIDQGYAGTIRYGVFVQMHDRKPISKGERVHKPESGESASVFEITGDTRRAKLQDFLICGDPDARDRYLVNWGAGDEGRTSLITRLSATGFTDRVWARPDRKGAPLTENWTFEQLVCPSTGAPWIGPFSAQAKAYKWDEAAWIESELELLTRRYPQIGV